MGGGLSQSSRYLILGCQGMSVQKLTELFGWFDFAGVIIFFAFLCRFRFKIVPTVAEEDDAEQVTPKDFAVEIDCLPRRIDQQTQYEEKLSKHLESRMQALRTERKTDTKHSEKGEVAEVVLVRDFQGKL